MKSLACWMAVVLTASVLPAAELWIGAATADITPDRPVPLTGGTTVRIAREILSPLTANVLALESREGERVVDQAILVSCDLCVIRPGIQEGFRKHLAGRLPGFDLNKLFLAATHTHDAPVLLQDRYDEKDYGDAMQPKEYVPWLYERMAEAVVKAWESRAAGAVAWGLGHAVVGHNRRVVYSDGTAKMHGNTNDPEFRDIEGYEDHAVHVLCFYDCAEAAQGGRHHPGLHGPSARAAPRSAPTSGTTCADCSTSATARRCACWDSARRPATRLPGPRWARRATSACTSSAA